MAVKIHGGMGHFRVLANRHLCWMFAAAGAALFRATVYLAKNGLLTRNQSLRLMRGSMHFHGLAIRMLRWQR